MNVNTGNPEWNIIAVLVKKLGGDVLITEADLAKQELQMVAEHTDAGLQLTLVAGAKN